MTYRYSDAAGGPARQNTSDAAAIEAGGDVVTYYFPKISSDGRYIAARRDAGVPVTEGVKYQFGLWVYDTETGEARAIYEDADSPPAGFDWKPGPHLLAYGIGSDPNYFKMSNGKPDATLATGIFAADLDTGASGAAQTWASGYLNSFQSWSYAKNAFDKWSMLTAQRLATLRGVTPAK